MKKYFSYLCGALLLAGFASCNDNEPNGGSTGELDGEQVFMSFNLENASRSQTTDQGESTDGVEVGTYNESKILSCQVILTDTQGTVVSVANTSTTNGDLEEGANQSYVASFNSKDLQASTPSAPVVYRVYLVCNGQVEAVKGTKLNTDVVNTLNSASELRNNFANSNMGFLMSNQQDDQHISVQMPENLKTYTTKNTPLNLGTFLVERAVARIDVMGKPGTTTTNANEYTIEGGNLIVTMKEVALVNMSKEFYTWKRVSENGRVDKGFVRGGVEHSKNYVVDCDYAIKNPRTYYYQLQNIQNEAEWLKMNETADWKTMFYTSENAIPAGPENQKNGVTTGLVFKAELTSDGQDNAVTTAMTKGETIYVYDNVCYGPWSNVAAIAANPTDAKQFALAAAYNKVTNDQVSKADAGFMEYPAAQDGKYYCKYFYWNRHNDNGNNGVMGIMEFATVRNNVYKVAVSSVLRYGLPMDGDNPDDDNPDEEENYYFKVVVKVLPWVVRINNVEF